MITRTIPIRDDGRTVFLEAYLLKDSPDFQAGVRRPAVIICPGGAYMRTSDREAEPIALRFLARGYHAFVLRYSVQTRFPQPMLDLGKAIMLVRANADEWLVEPGQVAVCGFSAGGHLAASLGVLWDDPLLLEPLGARPAQLRPDALILGYPVIDLELTDNTPVVVEQLGGPRKLRDLMLATVLGEPSEALKARYSADRHVSPATPPTFIWHTAEDQAVFPHNALRFATALADHKVPFELHIFARGEHGLALADETTAVEQRMIEPRSQVWIELALAWLKQQRERQQTGS